MHKSKKDIDFEGEKCSSLWEKIPNVSEEILDKNTELATMIRNKEIRLTSHPSSV